MSRLNLKLVSLIAAFGLYCAATQSAEAGLLTVDSPLCQSTLQQAGESRSDQQSEEPLPQVIQLFAGFAQGSLATSDAELPSGSAASSAILSQLALPYAEAFSHLVGELPLFAVSPVPTGIFRPPRTQGLL